MRALLYVCGLVLAGLGGYLLGRGERLDEARSAAGRGGVADQRTERRLVELPPDEVDALRRDRARRAELQAKNAELRARLDELSPPAHAGREAAELPPGSRRPDGSIVGGARWKKETQAMALGFLDTMLAQFFDEAGLTEHQKAKLDAELERRITEAMQVNADFVNGDATADQVYEQLTALVDDGRKSLSGVLDDKQLATYHRFERRFADFVRGGVVNNEMARMRKELGLDREQERLIRPLVERRFARVEERSRTAIPNLFFQPIRRERDRDIYDETGAGIRGHLTPDQAEAFQKLEAGANAPFADYRKLLIPKSR